MSESEQTPATVSEVAIGVPARTARIAAVLAGAGAGLAVLVFGPGAPWWMAPFIFLLAGVVILRLLRPLPRAADWTDEI
jgi:hypothetical protein